jgi:hypothetical protein
MVDMPVCRQDRGHGERTDGMSQTPEQIVKWAEARQDDKQKPQGKSAHLSPEQKQAIRVAYLETGGTVTYADMGRRCASIIGREVNRETVAACLKGPEYDKLRKHFDTEIKASAVERLKAGILPAADAWVKAVDVAADQGRPQARQGAADAHRDDRAARR